MVLGGNDALSATREHLVPKSRGGRNFVKKGRKRVRNIVAACKKCNNGRKDMDAHVFRSTMRPHIT